MHWQIPLAIVPTLWSAVTALRNPHNTRYDHSRHSPISHDPTLRDPLWTKYGLNASSEYKYFHEPGTDDILGHYDTRFFTEPVNDTERAETLTHMIRAYLNFFNENDLETWIAHGTLLGWWWNGKILPWDWDIDTQVPDTTLSYLADHFNQSIISYASPSSSTENRSYLLDINPWSRQRERGQGLNIIDARWIDTTTGLYIDITGLSRLDARNPGIWECKNFHKYPLQDIYPLRKTTFEGVLAKVPFQYDDMLREEYGEKALASTRFHNHTWVPALEEWISDEALANLTMHLPGELPDEGQYE